MKTGTFKKPTYEEYKLKQKLKFRRMAMKTKKPRARGNIRRWGVNLWTVNQADIRFSKWLRKKVGHCERCYTKEGLTCSHFIGRAEYATRFLEENCDVLCGQCHQEFESQKKTGYRNWKIAKNGEEVVKELESKKLSYKSVQQSVYDCMVLLGVVKQYDI